MRGPGQKTCGQQRLIVPPPRHFFLHMAFSLPSSIVGRWGYLAPRQRTAKMMASLWAQRAERNNSATQRGRAMAQTRNGSTAVSQGPSRVPGRASTLWQVWSGQFEMRHCGLRMRRNRRCDGACRLVESEASEGLHMAAKGLWRHWRHRRAAG